jgi:transposase-like protein
MDHEAEPIHGRADHWDPAATADVCRKHGISSATFYKWKAKYGGLEVSDAKRLKALEDEDAKLKKLLAEAMLDNAMLKDVAAMVTPAARREAVAHLRTSFEVSERRACIVLGADRTSVRHRSSRPNDAPVRARLRELAAVRRRFGYRRLLVLMPGGLGHEPQEVPSPLSRGTAAGTPAGRTQTSARQRRPNMPIAARPFPAELMRIWPISTRVNKPENDERWIIEPIKLESDAAIISSDLKQTRI